VLAVLDSAQLAPGRVYLGRIPEINNRSIFSRVGGVALGDAYRANIQHALDQQGPLHVPFTSTDRHHFGTGEVQVNPLVSRMLDSSLDNVGTYGVRFDLELRLTGNGPYELVMSHPSPSGGRDFTAFRGSLEILTPDGRQDVHVGLRSGQSLSLASLQLQPGVVTPVKVSMVYPADATPGHLLSVVPASQLALLRERERQLELARLSQPATTPAGPPPPPAGAGATAGRGEGNVRPLLPPPFIPNSPPIRPLRPSLPLVAPPPVTGNDYVDRYRRAIDAQRRQMQGWPQP
jgi:hypothetical protein